jgi:hypothetical protein
MKKASSQSCAARQTNMRWTVLRQVAISCFLVSLALPTAARTRAHYGGTLRVEIEGDPWTQHGGLARRMIFDGLTRMDADGNGQPASGYAPVFTSTTARRSPRLLSLPL